MRTLAEVRVGESASVTGIDGNDAVGARILEMGITPGIEIRVIGTAPLGDPIELEVRGYRLSLRRNEAARVEVAPA